MQQNEFLHLYLNCFGTLTRKTEDFLYQYYQPGNQILSGALYHEIMVMEHEFVLHLRPLSSISEEEKAEAQLEWHDNTFVSHFESMRYLLANQFDLFNLIESGIAIDKRNAVGNKQ